MSRHGLVGGIEVVDRESEVMPTRRRCLSVEEEVELQIVPTRSH